MPSGENSDAIGLSVFWLVCTELQVMSICFRQHPETHKILPTDAMSLTFVVCILIICHCVSTKPPILWHNITAAVVMVYF